MTIDELKKHYPSIKGYPHVIVNEILQDLINNHRIKNDIGIMYSGSSDGYFVLVDGEKVHFSKTRYEADMFIAELKMRLNK